MAALVPTYGTFTIAAAGDTVVGVASPPKRIVATAYQLSGNGNDMTVQIKSGTTVLVEFVVGPTSEIPGVTGQHNPDGWFATLADVDNLVVTVSGTGTIGLGGHITFDYR